MLKINWFSPLLPAQSGIAQNYAMQVLPELTRQHEVVLWTVQDQVAPEVKRLARVAHYDPASPPWREINNGAISIYHLGNQPDFHAAIWQVSQRHPGIVVLHDVCLHDFFYMLWVHHRKDRTGYLRALQRWYGEDGRRAGEAFCAGGISAETIAQRFPLTREAVRGALGAITHSSRALQDLQEVPACPMAALDHPYVPADESRYQRWLAARESVPHPPYRLVIFGHLSRNRRLEVVLEALAGLRERDRLRLDVCGQLWDERHIRGLVDRLGLASTVNLRGFLPPGDVEETLSTAHLAINLRYPSMGEASGTQLQFWDYGLPAMVTRTGWYTTLPEDAAAFVRPDHEVEDIQQHLRALLANPAAFRAMGERGRRSLQRHDPARYVEALTQFAGEAMRAAPHVPALALAHRVGSDLTAWLHPAASGYLLERASREIHAAFEGTRQKRKSGA